MLGRDRRAPTRVRQPTHARAFDRAIELGYCSAASASDMPALAAKIRDAARSGFGALPFSLATAALLLFQIGYSFETGDQLQYLLLPYREIFPNFLPGDWFTWQT